jgi:hypothetical protein
MKLVLFNTKELESLCSICVVNYVYALSLFELLIIGLHYFYY